MHNLQQTKAETVVVERRQTKENLEELHYTEKNSLLELICTKHDFDLWQRQQTPASLQNKTAASIEMQVLFYTQYISLITQEYLLRSKNAI